MKPKQLLAAALAALPLAAAACSSSSGAQHGTGPAGAGRAAQSSAVMTHAASQSADQASASGGGGFCGLLEHDAAVADALGGDVSTIDPSRYRAEIDKIVSAAPAAIKSDLLAFARAGTAMNKGDTGAAARMGGPQLVRQVRHFATWMQANCPGVLDMPTPQPTG